MTLSENSLIESITFWLASPPALCPGDMQVYPQSSKALSLSMQ